MERRASRRDALAVALALGAALCACPADKPVTRGGLRVPLPDGWLATPHGALLEAGPAGRPAVTLESRDAPLPALDALLAALAAEGTQVLEKESTETFVGARYLAGGDGGAPEAFVAVKRVGARTVWCASTSSATPEQARAGFGVCRGLSREEK